MFARALAIPILFLAGPTFGEEPNTFLVERSGNRARPENVRVVATPERVTIVVTHDFGIGGGAIRATGTWPTRVTLRFENFRSLESLRLANGERRVESRLGFGQKTSTSTVESFPATSKDDAKSLGNVTLPIVRRGKDIEVGVPTELIPGSKGTLAVHWVDAFRG